jgi:hypothetical protein
MLPQCEPLWRGQADAADHPFRHRLEFVIDRLHQPDELQHGILRWCQDMAWLATSDAAARRQER